jgi:YD repeat-containing protein
LCARSHLGVTGTTVAVNGLTIRTTSKSGLVYTYAYDAVGRRTGTTDPRTGTSTTHYNALGQVEWTEDAQENRTTFTYDPDTGRRTAVENALGKVRYTRYDVRGRVIRQWGDTDYPVAYEYDDSGRMTKMKTYRNGENWSHPVWPTDPGAADTPPPPSRRDGGEGEGGDLGGFATKISIMRSTGARPVVAVCSCGVCKNLSGHRLAPPWKDRATLELPVQT